MHLAWGRLVLQHQASSIPGPSVDSCLRSDRMRLMDAGSLSAEGVGDGGGAAVTGGPAQRQYVRLVFISSEF